jgi:hypothetical protein
VDDALVMKTRKVRCTVQMEDETGMSLMVMMAMMTMLGEWLRVWLMTRGKVVVVVVVRRVTEGSAISWSSRVDAELA